MRCNDRFKSHSSISINQYNNRYMTFQIIRIHKIIFLKLNKHNRSRHVHHRRCPPPDSRFLVRSRYSISFLLKMNLRQLLELERGPTENLIRWLQGRALLANPLRCPQCNQDMVLRERGDQHIDGFRWWVFDPFLFVAIETLTCFLQFSAFSVTKRSETLDCQKVSRIMRHSVGRSLQPSSRCEKFA